MDFPYPEYIHELVDSIQSVSSKNIIQIYDDNLLWNLRSPEIAEISKDYHFLFTAFEKNYFKLQKNYQKAYLFHKLLLGMNTLNCLPLEEFIYFQKLLSNYQSPKTKSESQSVRIIEDNNNYLQDDNASLSNFYYIRHISKDNNSLYRSIYISFIESLIFKKRIGVLISNISQAKKSNCLSNMVTKNDNFYDILITTLHQIEKHEVMGRISLFLYINIYLKFDLAMITYLKEIINYFRRETNKEAFEDKQKEVNDIQTDSKPTKSPINNPQEICKNNGNINQKNQEIDFLSLMKFFELIYQTKIYFLNFNIKNGFCHFKQL